MLRCLLSILMTRLGPSYRQWDLKWPWMFCRQQVWRLFPFRVFPIYPTLGVDLAKLLPLESPNTQITWHLMLWTIQFDFPIGCSDETMAPSFLSHWTSLVVDALPKSQLLDCCQALLFMYCCGCVVFVVVDFLFLYLFSTILIIGPWVIMYVIFVVFIIGF